MTIGLAGWRAQERREPRGERPPRLEIWLHGRVIAELEMSRRQSPLLRYREDYVAERGDGAPGLSVPLPVSSRPFRGDVVGYWMESLLPEGEARTVLEQYFGARRGDGFALLAAIGRDCAGAVAALPPGGEPAPATRAPEPLTPAELAEAVAALRRHPLGVDEDVRASLAGLQRKLLLVQADAGWARPAIGLPSTHILKPDRPEYPGLVAGEAFTQRAAAMAGLAAAESRLETIGGRTVLVVTRFDRDVTGATLRRRHQEDGCQALGLDPSGPAKYQNLDGTASYRQLARVLASHAGDVAAELRRLAAMLTFTIAVGNTDAHLRNHAFLHADGKLTLAPIYDAAPTIGFAGNRQLALWIDEQPLLTAVTRAQMIREITAWGVDRDEAAQVVSGTLAALAGSYDEAARAVPEAPAGVVDACRRRTESLLKSS